MFYTLFWFLEIYRISFPHDFNEIFICEFLCCRKHVYYKAFYCESCVLPYSIVLLLNLWLSFNFKFLRPMNPEANYLAVRDGEKKTGYFTWHGWLGVF